MNQFKVSDKIDFNHSEFRTKVRRERTDFVEAISQSKNHIWGDNVPDLLDEDKFDKQRMHCWVLVKSAKRGIKHDIFLEPSTGSEFLATESPYEKVIAVFNNID